MKKMFKLEYETPQIEFVEYEVENGFAKSSDYYDDDMDVERINDWL